jgi:hypothetical protein
MEGNWRSKPGGWKAIWTNGDWESSSYVQQLAIALAGMKGESRSAMGLSKGFWTEREGLPGADEDREKGQRGMNKKPKGKCSSAPKRQCGQSAK